jgi:flagellar hook-basal body complex protein FliE
MSVQAISNNLAAAASSLPNAAAQAAAGGLDGASSDSFTSTLRSALGSVDQAQTSAADKVNSLLSGSGEDVHDAMIGVEKASLSFSLMLQVRNKMVSAYQEVSRLQF